MVYFYKKIFWLVRILVSAQSAHFSLLVRKVRKVRKVRNGKQKGFSQIWCAFSYPSAQSAYFSILVCKVRNGKQKGFSQIWCTF